MLSIFNPCFIYQSIKIHYPYIESFGLFFVFIGHLLCSFPALFDCSDCLDLTLQVVEVHGVAHQLEEGGEEAEEVGEVGQGVGLGGGEGQEREGMQVQWMV